MSETGAPRLLNAAEMAFFAANGYLAIENLVPRELNEAVHHDEVTIEKEKQSFQFWNHS